MVLALDAGSRENISELDASPPPSAHPPVQHAVDALAALLRHRKTNGVDAWGPGFTTSQNTDHSHSDQQHGRDHPQ